MASQAVVRDILSAYDIPSPVIADLLDQHVDDIRNAHDPHDVASSIVDQHDTRRLYNARLDEAGAYLSPHFHEGK